jgi:hypothetical protein
VQATPDSNFGKNKIFLEIILKIRCRENHNHWRKDVDGKTRGCRNACEFRRLQAEINPRIVRI